MSTDPQSVQPGRYLCEHDDPSVQTLRGEVNVIQDERGFPTILINRVGRWPIHMLPEGTRLRPLMDTKNSQS